MTTSVGINGDFLMRGNAQRVEVSVARRIFRLHGFTDHTPHVASRVNADMRHTLDKSTRQFSGTNRTFGRHAQIPSP
jgi:hypothetical protein